ncbi:tRNA-dihydrouridine synthase [Mycolicibacterium conceptionense]|uniref:Probable tRNA-dihydrouridine synthase n=1 Tax=Mycolicibacterium conceptionense TaxID=451644 RepID=A0A0U1DDS5_9MYCO|nr:tRNA-dihydrouridine synthase [Mycolicibacterium conceptionense]
MTLTASPPETAASARSQLRIGPFALPSPVVLAPMAGVTNVAFRTLCRELEIARAGTVSGLYVCEMVTARALVERHPVTMHMTTFGLDESPRSLQLYTVDPQTTYLAAKMIADEGMADHIDMNFGCPVPKVTKRGGGSALPYKRRLFGQIVAAAVRGVEGTDIPVTVKFRIGIDDAHHTHLDAGRIAAEEGAAAVALHARTAAQRYSGTADWDRSRRSKPMSPAFRCSATATSSRPLRAGDDGRHRLQNGVVIGRGCLGRPWLFAELSAAFTGRPAATPPNLGEVADIVRRHGELLSEHFGEDKGMRDIRKHVAWYLHGFPAGAELAPAGLALVKTPRRTRRAARRPVPARGDRSARTAGVGCLRIAARGMARRSRRLRGPGRGRCDAFRRLTCARAEMTSRQLCHLVGSSSVSGCVSTMKTLSRPAQVASPALCC